MSCGIRSQEIVERARFAASILGKGFVSKAAKDVLFLGEAAFPAFFIGDGVENL